MSVFPTPPGKLDGLRGGQGRESRDVASEKATTPRSGSLEGTFPGNSWEPSGRKRGEQTSRERERERNGKRIAGWITMDTPSPVRSPAIVELAK